MSTIASSSSDATSEEDEEENDFQFLRDEDQQFDNSNEQVSEPMDDDYVDQQDTDENYQWSRNVD